MDHLVRKLIVAGIGLSLCLMAAVGVAQAQPVTDVLLAADPGESWLHTNGNWAGHRFSTLTELNTSNVKNLKPAWLFSTGGKTDAQNTPLYHDRLVDAGVCAKPGEPAGGAAGVHDFWLGAQRSDVRHGDIVADERAVCTTAVVGPDRRGPGDHCYTGHRQRDQDSHGGGQGAVRPGSQPRPSRRQ